MESESRQGPALSRILQAVARALDFIFGVEGTIGEWEACTERGEEGLESYRPGFEFVLSLSCGLRS